MLFDKPALSIDQLVTKLTERGLIVANAERAKRYLLNIGYYRLSAYMLPFRRNNQNHLFVENVNFDSVLNLYIFDRKLRLLLLDAIERLEISLRAQLIDNTVMLIGPHGYLDKNNFHQNYNHQWLLSKIESEMEASREVFIEHYKRKYTTPQLPPFWMVMQLLTFKEMTFLLRGIKDSSIANNIAAYLDVKNDILFSWSRSISDLRNLCAHHNRIWNRVFGSKPKLPKKAPSKWPSNILNSFEFSLYNGNLTTIDPQSSLCYQIVIIWHWMKKINPTSNWMQRFLSIIDEHKIDAGFMGFHRDALSDEFWLKPEIKQ
ncbi:AbiD phage protein-like protein [Legionella birminghamensis]|uniref:AbiD phage protein-like n=1 Tax=Legionella birminghamensis TaxID=28083 RepID=A0A378I7U1_9GAMM|nr:Abi family protein [Legionella birminghamensis]KTC76012.1 AbiD phage protein-like protein [Legionella birminghamensis]STX30825.1 AbiD phage protein-like [Legionella birminghamensis]